MSSSLQARRAIPMLILSLLLVALAGVAHSAVLGPAGLRAQHAELGRELEQNVYGRPLVLQSQEADRRAEGDVYAVLSQPFAVVSAALTDPAHWCDMLILHLNTKYCRSTGEGGAAHIELRVGKKHEEPIKSASLLAFDWRTTASNPGYFGVEMGAPDGPMDTRDYRMVAEAVPLDDGHTFLHMGYAFGYGGASHFAMHVYLSTVARDKVGFTRIGPGDGDGGGGRGRNAGYVGGMRGVVERNTMRYYLAIESYLGSLKLPREQQLEQRLASWFDATEKYSRQLHELDRDEYLRMKRNEVRRQNEVR